MAASWTSSEQDAQGSQAPHMKCPQRPRWKLHHFGPALLVTQGWRRQDVGVPHTGVRTRRHASSRDRVSKAGSEGEGKSNEGGPARTEATALAVLTEGSSSFLGWGELDIAIKIHSSFVWLNPLGLI